MADEFEDDDEIIDEENTTVDSDVVVEAIKLFERDRSNWSEVYQRALEDLEFQSDKPYAQWDDASYSDRKQTGRPVITLDQLSQFVHQVVNDIRQNTPSINCIPAGEASDPETADIYKGIIKGIEYQSSADVAYDTAATNSVKASFGFIRVDHDYVNETGFEQTLCIKRVINPLATYIDSNSVTLDGSDAKHAHVLEDMTVGEFKDRWPGFDPVNFSSKKERRGSADGDSEMVTVCEFFQIEEEQKEISLAEDGSIAVGEKIEGTSSRKVKRVKVKRYWLSGKDVLEEGSFPGKYIPIVPVYGEEAWIDGKRHLYSLIRKAKDGQMMFNLWASLETELLLKQPQAPVMVPAGAIEDYSQDWKSPSKSMALRYEMFDDQDRPYNKPERLQPPTIPTGIVNAKQESLNDIKSTLGMYSASLGQKSNAISGVAYNAQKTEGDVATSHFAENLNVSIAHVGKILVSGIPEVIDTPQIIRIIGAEDEPQMVGVNGAPMQEGQERPFDLRTGSYDVRVVTGPSYTTKRQETVAALNQLFQAQPQLMQVFGDIYFKNSDFAGAEAMAARAEKLLPPNLKDDNQQNPEVMAAQQKLQQAQQIIQQGAQEIQSLQQQLQSKQADNQLKAQDNQLKAQSDTAKLQLDQQQMQINAQLKEQELQLKQKELELKEGELHIKLFEAQKPPEPPKQESEPMGLDENALMAQLESVRGRKQQEDAQRQAETDKAMMSQQQEQQRLAQQQMIVEGIAGVQNMLGQLVSAINSPKQVVYKDGQIVGVK